MTYAASTLKCWVNYKTTFSSLHTRPMPTSNLTYDLILIFPYNTEKQINISQWVRSLRMEHKELHRENKVTFCSSDSKGNSETLINSG